MRIVFMGTPDFAVPTLGALVSAGHHVVGVYTQPPRAAGRGLEPRKSPVQIFAETKKQPVNTPPSLKSADEQAPQVVENIDREGEGKALEIRPAFERSPSRDHSDRQL